jgi:hypothetical protein
VRMAMIEVERALEHVASAAEAAAGPAAAALPAGKAAAGVEAEAEAAAATEGLEHQGLFAYRLAVVGCWLIEALLHCRLAWLPRACSVLRVPQYLVAGCGWLSEALQSDFAMHVHHLLHLAAWVRCRLTRRLGSCSAATGGSSPSVAANGRTSGAAVSVNCPRY